MSKTLRLFIAFSIVPQILFIKILSSYPYWVEENYSNMVYPKISNALRLLYGWVPFSVGDLLYITAIGYVLWWFFTHRKKVLKSPRKTIVGKRQCISNDDTRNRKGQSSKACSTNPNFGFDHHILRKLRIFFKIWSALF